MFFLQTPVQCSGLGVHSTRQKPNNQRKWSLKQRDTRTKSIHYLLVKFNASWKSPFSISKSAYFGWERRKHLSRWIWGWHNEGATNLPSGFEFASASYSDISDTRPSLQQIFQRLFAGLFVRWTPLRLSGGTSRYRGRVLGDIIRSYNKM